MNRTTRAASVLTLICFTVLVSGCGVHFNCKPAPPKSYSIFGSSFSSGQNGDQMTPPTCAPSAVRPCAKARASVGIPLQFDINTNGTMGAITAGTSFPAAGPYVTNAGPGNTAGTAK